MKSHSTEAAAHDQMPAWVRKIGLFGFLFFLVKGLLWLSLPFLLVLFGIGNH